ncbi:MAG: peptidoglycan-binding protein [Oscillospiraceae bacterium]|nr:peptidoglycan-binding protein [Oscillospiraceae bacterium]
MSFAKNNIVFNLYTPDDQFVDALKALAAEYGIDLRVKRSCGETKTDQPPEEYAAGDYRDYFGPGTLMQNSTYKETVKNLQKALKSLGTSYNPGTPDGIYGGNTVNAVMAFQEANNLTKDGMAGPITKQALFSAITNATRDTLTIVPW